MRRFRFRISDLLVLVIVSALGFASYRLLEMLGVCFFLIAVQLSLNSLASAKGCFRADRPVWTAFALAGWVGFSLECSFLAGATNSDAEFVLLIDIGVFSASALSAYLAWHARRENRRPSRQSLPNEDVSPPGVSANRADDREPGIPAILPTANHATSYLNPKRKL